MTPPQKLRILIVSLVVPATNRGGGCLALHRHFQQRHDFNVVVAGPYLVGVRAIRKLPLRHHPLIHRLLHSGKLCRVGHNLACLINWLWLPPRLIRFTRRWRPDAIFCVPDNHVMGWAWQLSRRLNVPLIINFQDLFPLKDYRPTDPQRPWPWVRRFLIRRYHFLNRNAALALYTSEGMRIWFAKSPSRNGHVLYPVGADSPLAPLPEPPSRFPITLVYSGNCYGPYGRMLRSLAQHLRHETNIKLIIHPVGIDWPKHELEFWQKNGVVRSPLPFMQLQEQLKRADLLLTAMSFDYLDRPFAETSFTTKWLDYAPTGKPVVVWAPEYSSASRFAQTHLCALVVNDPNPTVLVREILRLANDPVRWVELGNASLRVARGPLNSGQIHQRLVDLILSICT